MDKDLKEQLDLLNKNLQAVIMNQAMLYCKLEEIEGKIKQGPKA